MGVLENRQIEELGERDDSSNIHRKKSAKTFTVWFVPGLFAVPAVAR